MNLRQHFHLILPLMTVLILSTVVCAEPSLTATNATLGTDRPIRVHFIAFSEVAYHDPYKTLPAFAEVLHREYGMQCTLSLSKKKDHFPDNLKAMADADLLVMFCRHMAKLPADQSQLLHAWCEAGKPIVATEHFDEEAQRKQLREGLAKLRGCHVEVYMHEPMTVHHEIKRIAKWAEIALQEAERAAT